MSDNKTQTTTSDSPAATSQKRWLLPVMIGLGLLIALVIKHTRPVMEHQATDLSQGADVATITVSAYPVKPTVTGYGEVIPDTLLDLRAEISGRVTYVHPQLRKGAVLPKGTLVLRIDDQDYQLALRQADASLAQNEAKLEELTLTLQDAAVNLQLAKDKLAINQKEMDRNQSLLQKGSISQSSYDAQLKALLQQKQEVQNLASQVSTLPMQVKVQEAQIERAKADIATQQRNLARTEIHLPFNARITRLNTEENQFVSLGTSLFSAQTMDKVLVNAQFPLEHFRRLISGINQVRINAEMLIANGDSATNHIVDQLGLQASVRLVGSDGAIWQGKVEQISNNLDPSSRTLGATIGIEEPYKDIVPGVKPPLVEGMYTEVQLRAPASTFMVVPRAALNGNEAYLVGDDNRLKRVTLSGITQGDMLLLASGLTVGQKLVTSDLFPAVEGMLLAPHEDTETASVIRRWLEAY